MSDHEDYLSADWTLPLMTDDEVRADHDVKPRMVTR